MQHAISAARSRQWQQYVEFCREMEAFDDGAFYAADPIKVELWNGQRSMDLNRRVMSKYVMRAMPDLWKNAWTEVEAAAFGWPLVRRVKDALATAFAEQVDVHLIDPRTGNRLRADSGPYADLVRLWPHIYESSDLPQAFMRAEQLRELHRCAFLWFRIFDGQIVTDALPPHAVEIDPDARIPRDLQRAQRVSVPYAGTAHEADENAWRVVYERDGRGIRFDVIDGGDQRVQGEAEYPAAYDDGSTDRVGSLLLDRYPVVGWYATQPDGPYAEPDYALHKSQIGLNLWLIQLNEAYHLGSMGLWTASGVQPRGMDSEGSPILPKKTLSYRSIMSLEEGEEIKLTQARAQIGALFDAVERRLKLEAIARNLPPYVMDTNRQPSNVSGEARGKERMDLELAQQRRERMLAMDAERALDMWRRMWNRLNPSQAMPPEDVGFRVVFKSLPSDSLDQSAAQAAQINAALGIEPPWEYVRVRERMSVSDAMSAVRRYAAFANPQQTDARPDAAAV